MDETTIADSMWGFICRQFEVLATWILCRFGLTKAIHGEGLTTEVLVVVWGNYI
jgi:hypothetical protein